MAHRAIITCSKKHNQSPVKQKGSKELLWRSAAFAACKTSYSCSVSLFHTPVLCRQKAQNLHPPVCVFVLYAVWICRRPAYRSLWAHEGRHGGWGLGAADMAARFKEIAQEMQWEGEHSSHYAHLGWAWENSAAPSPPCPRLWLQTRKQVDLQVLRSTPQALDTPQSATSGEKKHLQYSMSTKSWKMGKSDG